MVISISDIAEMFGGLEHFCLMEKHWLLHILWWPIHKSSEKQMLDSKTMYDCVISKLNSKQLVLGLKRKFNIVIFHQ